MSLKLCREPSEEILRNITLGLYRVRLVRIARSKLTGRFVSVRSEAYVQNPNEYIVFESGQVYNRINGRIVANNVCIYCLLYTSPSPRDGLLSRMPSSA